MVSQFQFLRVYYLTQGRAKAWIGNATSKSAWEPRNPLPPFNVSVALSLSTPEAQIPQIQCIWWFLLLSLRSILEDHWDHMESFPALKSIMSMCLQPSFRMWALKTTRSPADGKRWTAAWGQAWILNGAVSSWALGDSRTFSHAGHMNLTTSIYTSHQSVL